MGGALQQIIIAVVSALLIAYLSNKYFGNEVKRVVDSVKQATIGTDKALTR